MKTLTEVKMRKLVNELIKVNNDIIRSKLDKVLKSGCIELSDYPDNHQLPNLFMYAISTDMCFRFYPFSKKLCDDAKNMTAFM